MKRERQELDQRPSTLGGVFFGTKFSGMDPLYLHLERVCVCGWVGACVL